MGSAVAHRKKRSRTGQVSAEVTSEDPGLTSPTSPQADEDEDALASLKIHDCAFLKWDVKGIVAVAASPSGNLIAVARDHGNIELRDRAVIWATTALSYIESSRSELSVTCMQFSSCSGFLLAGRLDGSLLIFRVTREGLSEHVRLEPGGGAIWGLDICRDDPEDRIRIAVACDDGCVRVISLDPTFCASGSDALGSDNREAGAFSSSSAHYIVRISESTTSRALSVSWAPSAVGGLDGCVVCGDSDGGVRWLNASSGALYGRGKVASVRREAVLIWTVQFVSGGREVVCGDSRGMATVWSTSTNTMTTELPIEGLKGALWSSTRVSTPAQGEFVLFGSAGGGVGGVKSHSQSVEDSEWLPVRGTRLHTHDIRAISSFPSGAVVTGSMDARCTLFRPSDLIDRKTVTWIYPHYGGVGQPSVQFCTDKGMILSRYRKCVEVWSVPNDAETPVLDLRMQLKSFKVGIRAVAMSNDCSTMAASSDESFRVYNVSGDVGKLRLPGKFGKVKSIPLSSSHEALMKGAVDMAFCGDILVCLSKSRESIFFYRDGQLVQLSKEDVGSEAMSFSKLACSTGKVAVSDTKGLVHYAVVQGDERKKLSPKWSSVFSSREVELPGVSALQFSRSGSKLAVATRDFALSIITLDEVGSGCMTLRSKFSSTVTAISFSPDEGSMLVSGYDFCTVVAAQESADLKRKAGKGDGAKSLTHSLPFRRAVLGSTVLGPSRIAVVHRPWKLVQETLSDAIPRKPFGT